MSHLVLVSARHARSRVLGGPPARPGSVWSHACVSGMCVPPYDKTEYVFDDVSTGCIGTSVVRVLVNYPVSRACRRCD